MTGFSAIDKKEPAILPGGEMEELIRSLDWSKTSMGPRENWSQALKTMVRILLANRFPMLLWWGPEYISIYNDAYIPILGQKHPWGLGRPVCDCWSEIWDVLKPLIDTPFHGGPATWSEDIELHIKRTGVMEETHFTIAYSPVPDETAPCGIGGVLATVHEITAKIVGERRGAQLREVASAVEAKTAEQACVNALAKLASQRRDIPFALLYLCGEDVVAALAGATGVENAVGVAPSSIRLDDKSALWPLHEAQASGRMQLVELSSRFAAIPKGPWPEPPSQAAVLPIRSHLSHQFSGFLIAGLSSRIKPDESYTDFLKLVASQIASAVSTARAYEGERRRADALAEIDRAKTAFFSNVSHEFRTPLTLMLGPLEEVLKEQDQLAPAHRERVDMAHRNSLRLLKLVNSLLDFSRIEAGRMQASYAPTDLAAATRDLASNFRSALQAAGLEFVVQCAPLPEPVYVDQDMWEKIVLNLLSNAFKFTFDGRISVALEAVDRQVILSVSDTGTGIPEAELPHIFERFHRVESSKGRSYEGAGIGLALVQELVRMHGGAVTVESEVGKGSTFFVRIPRGSKHLAPDRVKTAAAEGQRSVHADAYIEQAHRWLSRNDGPSSDVLGITDEGLSLSGDGIFSPANRNPRVLLAEDNADMRDYVVRLLGNGIDVTAANNGKDALATALKNPPDLVLSDVMMPLLDGFGLLRELRADAKTSGIPVILLSARSGEESRIKGLSAGADDYLVKPFSAGELLARVTAHLNLARARQETMAMMRRLQEISTRLIGEEDLSTLLGEFLDAAIEITRADMGIVQLLDSSTGELKIAAQRGVDRPLLDFFNSVPRGMAGFVTAMQQGRRTIVEDVASSPMFDSEARKVVLGAGVRAMQATPLATRSGKSLGMISTYFRSPSRSADRDLQLLDVLARQAADLIERELAEQALRRNSAKLAQDLAALTRMHELSTRQLSSDGFESLLREIMNAAVDTVGAEMGMLHLIEGDTVRIVAHVGHQQSFLEFFGDAKAQESVCGEAMKYEGRVMVEDVEASPLFAGSPSLPVLRASGVRAVQSTPLFSRQGKMLGVLTTHWKIPRVPDEQDLWRLDLLIRQAADLIESSVNAEILRANEERLTMALEAAGMGTWDVDLRNGMCRWSRRHFEILGYPQDLDHNPSMQMWRSRVHPDDLEKVDRALERAQAPGERYVSEHRIIRADNREVRWVAEFGRYVRNPHRGAQRLLGVSFDITERVEVARSSLLLGAIVDSSDDAIISKDLDGVITSWNRSAERLFGYTAEEAIGQTIARLLIPADRQDEEPSILLRLRRGERVDHFETVRRRKDGRLLDISLTISPVKDDKGRIIGASKIARDITDRRQAEAELRKSEERFRLAQQAAKIGVFEWDFQTGLNTWSPELEELYGLQPGAFPGTRSAWEALVHPADREGALARVEEALNKGTLVEGEWRVIWPDGSVHWIAGRFQVHRDAAGAPFRMTGVNFEITERKWIENELRRANTDLEQFAYSASHDLQEPLRSVKIFSELVADRYSYKLNEEALEFMSNVREGASRMEMLVRDLLAYTQTAQIEETPEPAEANIAFQAAVASLAGAIAETGATISCDPLPAVRVLAIQLQQLFQNLIGNAVKYHRAGAPPVVHLTVRRDNGNWIFSVKDNGIGIEPQYKEKIFGLFKRLHTREEYSGSGIGLALCRRIVERRHGRIWVESEPGNGSSFHFTLPV